MISELDRHHGVVLRQIVVGHVGPMTIAVADRAGRVDCFVVQGAAFQIKHSAKRLSPWPFTYSLDQVTELRALREEFGKVWVMLVCGVDGVVAISLSELESILQVTSSGVASIRVSRSRSSMYRVTGTLGELARAKPMGVQPFLSDVFGDSATAPNQ